MIGRRFFCKSSPVGELSFGLVSSAYVCDSFSKDCQVNHRLIESLFMQNRRFILGAITWLVLSTGAVLAVRSQFAADGKTPWGTVAGISGWMAGAPEEYSAVSATSLLLAPGDPVFLRTPDGGFRQVGRVRNNFAPAPQSTTRPVSPLTEAYTQKATIVLYDSVVKDAFPLGYQLEYHTTPTALDWVATTLITPERQQEIANIIAKDWEKHREQVIARLQPVFETGIGKCISAIEAELPTVLSNHRSDFAKLADRYQVEIIRSQVVPLVRAEILPIVQEEVRPLATELGKDLWNRVSLFSFTWRYLYDVSPLPEKNAVKLEFDRFMKEEVTPALESRSDEFVAVTERILGRISRNEKVRSVVRENLKKVATDKELQTIVWAIVQDSVINNQTLRATMREYWASPEVQSAMTAATSNFETTARTIGDTIFGSRDGGVTPEFARVLRTQILMKDRRWFVLVPKPTTPMPLPRPEVNGLVMVMAREPMAFPLEFEGVEQSPLSVYQPEKGAMPPTPLNDRASGHD